MFNIVRRLIAILEGPTRSFGVGPSVTGGVDDPQRPSVGLQRLRLGLAVAVFAAIGWSLWRMPASKAPDPLSCSAVGRPFNPPGQQGPANSPGLTLSVAFLAGLSREHDFCVFRDDRWVGRIWIAQGTPLNPEWRWEISPPLPTPAWGNGTAKSLPEAKEALTNAWARFSTALTPNDIARWHHTADTVIRR